MPTTPKSMTPPDAETDDLLPLSALQHYLYCPRQCALIHVERQWVENRFTAEGRLLHAKTDAGAEEVRDGVRIARAVPVRSTRLGVFGIADVVELHEEGRRPVPVEYKRGRPKAHRADEVQLAAQAIALEEMLGEPVPEAFLFYGKTRRRKRVVIDGELRALTEATAKRAREMVAAGLTPSPEYEARKCDACSLKQVCWPERLEHPPSVADWLARQLER